MKTKFYKSFFGLFLIAGVLIFSFTQCKKVGTSDWPEPNPETLNELKVTVFDGDRGNALTDFTVTVITPDGILSEYQHGSGSLNLEGKQVGTYIISATKTGYLSLSAMVEVEKTPEGVIAVTKERFYLSKLGNSATVSASGASMAIESDFEQAPILTFPEGAVSQPVDVTVTYIPSPSKFGDFEVKGDRAIQSGFSFSPDLTFPENAKATLQMPVTIAAVLNGDSPMLLGSFNEDTQEWEIIEGVLNEDRTMATFEMPHFSLWYTFTGFRLVKTLTWSPYELSGQSENCSEGACGTFVYSIGSSALVTSMAENSNFDLKVVDTRCIGPRYQYAQQLFTRCRLANFKIYNYTGEYKGDFVNFPFEVFNWKVQETYCHHQGWGN
ncbi:MAG TPA: hypothetical protein VFC92_13870 [Bacteroidales bacterium]|nr:hypothetical protein [Bacteroidales bacterium]